MPPSSDPFDDDDELFANAEFLDDLEASALQSTQAPAPKAPPKTRITQPYHHTIARPSQTHARPSQPQPALFSGRKEPAPLNTEPRAGNSGFGWEFGGKRSIEGNVERHIAAIGERAAYWSHGHRNEEEEYPDVVVGADGRYGIGMEDEGEEVVDNHARTGESLLRDTTKGAAARREAIAAAVRQASMEVDLPPQAGPSKLPQGLAPPPPQPFAQRSLSRSVSAGAQPISRPQSRTSNLPPIASQSSQSSQGSAVRRAAIELEEERRKREAVEAELRSLRDQLQAEASKAKGEERANDDTVVGGDSKKRINNLQAELWRAKGEAETMRRTTKDEQARFAGEADKLRAKISNMEVELQERKKDSARVVESVKTQAIFNNHAVLNSAARARASSQKPGPSTQARPAPTPMRNGSPRGKSVYGEGDSMLGRNVKGKAKAPPPAPRFDNLNNAFSTPVAVSRAKRARTEAMSPAPRSPTNLRSPGPSPTKHLSQNGGRSSPAPDMVEEMMQDDNDIEWQPGIYHEEPMVIEEFDEPNHKAELLYHLFNHIPLSPLQYAIDPLLVAQPTIYRILNYRPPQHLDPTSLYAKACGNLLRACGDAELAYEALLEVLARTGISILGILASAFANPDTITPAEIAATINVFTLLSTTTWLFPPLISAFSNHDLDVGGLLKTMINRVFADLPCLDRVKGRVPEADWPRELAECMADLSEGICWFGDGSMLWKGDELVDVILGLTAVHLDVRIVRRGLEVAWSAACYKSNFRAVLAASERWPGDQPVLERLSRYLMGPHPKADDEESLRQTTTIIRAFSMLSIATPEAVILIAERSLLVPALILLLQREGTKVWGVHMDPQDPIPPLQIIHPAVSLLHHLIYPIPLPKRSAHSPSQTQSRPELASEPDAEPEPLDGLNLARRLHDASMQKEFNGLAHILVSCLGAMAYASPDLGIDEEKESWRWGGGDVTSLQYLAQDLLESVVEGPEGDAIFEIFEEVEEPVAGGGPTGEGVAGGEIVDEEMYEAMAMDIGDDIE